MRLLQGWVPAAVKMPVAVRSLGGWVPACGYLPTHKWVPVPKRLGLRSAFSSTDSRPGGDDYLRVSLASIVGGDAARSTLRILARRLGCRGVRLRSAGRRLRLVGRDHTPDAEGRKDRHRHQRPGLG